MLDTIIVFFVSGVIFGAVYDFFRFFRLVFKSKAVSFALDFIFFIIISVAFFILLLGYNNGMVRAYFVLLTFLGFLLYAFTVFRLTVKAEKPIALAVRKLFKKLLQFIRRVYIMFLDIFKSFKKKEVKPDDESIFSKAEAE